MPIRQDELSAIMQKYAPEKREEISSYFNSLGPEHKQQIADASWAEVEGFVTHHFGRPESEDPLSFQVAPADVTQTEMPPQEVSWDPTRGVEDIVGTGRGSMIMAGLAAEPSMSGKLRILNSQGLKVDFGPEGQVLLIDPNDPDTRISIDANHSTLGDFAAFLPEMGRTALEMWGDYKLMGQQGFGFPLKNLATRGLVAAGVGALGGAGMEAIAASMGAHDGLTGDEKLEKYLRRAGLDGAANLLGFGVSEVAGRAIRKGTQGVMHRGTDRTPGDVYKTELADFAREQGFPGETLLRARDPVSNWAATLSAENPRWISVRTKAQDILDNKMPRIWEQITKPRPKDTRPEAVKHMLDTPDEALARGASEEVMDAIGHHGKVLGRVESGETTQKALEGWRRGMEEQFEELFSTVGEVVGSTRGEAPLTLAKAEQLLHHFRGDARVEAVLKRYRKKFRIKSRVPEDVSIDEAGALPPAGGGGKEFGDLGKGKPGKFSWEMKSLSYNTLKNIRTALGKEINWYGSSPEGHVMKELYHDLTQDLLNVARKHSPDTVRSVERINTEYAQFKDVLDNSLVKNIQQEWQGSKIRSRLFETPESIDVFRKVVTDPKEQQAIAAGHLRDYMGIKHGQTVGDFDVDAAKLALDRMKRVEKAGPQETYWKVFGDDGIFSREAGESVYETLDNIERVQLAHKARETFAKDILELDAIDSMETPRRVAAFRDQLNAYLRTNQEDIAPGDVQILTQLADEVEAFSITNTLRRKLAEDLKKSREYPGTKALMVNPRKFKDAVNGFLKNVPEDQLSSLKLSPEEAVHADQFYRRILSPEELEGIQQTRDFPASVLEQFDFKSQVTNPADLMVKGPRPQTVPTGVFQWLMMKVRAVRKLLAMPMARVIVPESFADKGTRTGMKPRITDALSRAARGEFKDPERRVLEAGIRTALRAYPALEAILTGNPEHVRMGSEIAESLLPSLFKFSGDQNAVNGGQESP